MVPRSAAEPSQPIQVSCRCSRSTNAVVKRFATSASAQHHVGVIYIYILFMISHSRFETKQNASPRYNSPRQPTPCSSRPHHRYRIQLPREIRKFGCKQFLHEAKFWLPPTPDDTSPPCALRALRNAVVCMTYAPLGYILSNDVSRVRLTILFFIGRLSRVNL